MDTISLKKNDPNYPSALKQRLRKNRGVTSSFFTSLKNEDSSVCCEKRKIKYGKAHFDEFDGVEYRQVAKVSDLD